MADDKKILALLSRAARGGLITVHEAAKVLDMQGRMASRKLANLERSGWLTRVRRGLYYIRPLEALPDRPSTAPDPWVVASVLYDPCYIGGWSAAEHWDLTEQIFRETFVVTARFSRSSHEAVLGLDFRIVRVSPKDRVLNTGTVWRDGDRIRVSSPERTLVDGLNDPTWLGGWRHLEQVVETYMGGRRGELATLRAGLVEHGRGAAFKRLGFLSERRWPDERTLIDLCLEQRSRGVVRLDPALPKRGRLDKRWGLWVNTKIS